MTTKTAKQITADGYRQKATEIVARLHAAAERFGRESLPSDIPSVTDCPRYTYAAQAALKGLQWDLANIGAAYLIGEAGLADAAERTPVVTRDKIRGLVDRMVRCDAVPEPVRAGVVDEWTDQWMTLLGGDTDE